MILLPPPAYLFNWFDPGSPDERDRIPEDLENQYVDSFLALDWSNMNQSFITNQGEVVELFRYRPPDPADIIQTVFQTTNYDNLRLRLFMGDGEATDAHPVRFRPVLQVENDDTKESTFWDFSTPCPPNCAGGH